MGLKRKKIEFLFQVVKISHKFQQLMKDEGFRPAEERIKQNDKIEKSKIVRLKERTYLLAAVGEHDFVSTYCILSKVEKKTFLRPDQKLLLGLFTDLLSYCVVSK